jgi:hypothetical protein
VPSPATRSEKPRTSRSARSLASWSRPLFEIHRASRCRLRVLLGRQFRPSVSRRDDGREIDFAGRGLPEVLEYGIQPRERGG